MKDEMKHIMAAGNAANLAWNEILAEKKSQQTTNQLTCEIELIEKMCRGSLKLAKNKELPIALRESAREEYLLFKSILQRLKQINQSVYAPPGGLK